MFCVCRSFTNFNWKYTSHSNLLCRCISRRKLLMIF